MLEEAVHVDRRMLLHGHCLVLDTPQLDWVVVADGEGTGVLLASGEGACEGGLHVVVVVVCLHEHHELLVGGGAVVVVVGVGGSGMLEELVAELDGGIESVVGWVAEGRGGGEEAVEGDERVGLGGVGVVGVVGGLGVAGVVVVVDGAGEEGGGGRGGAGGSVGGGGGGDGGGEVMLRGVDAIVGHACF